MCGISKRKYDPIYVFETYICDDPKCGWRKSRIFSRDAAPCPAPARTLVPIPVLISPKEDSDKPDENSKSDPSDGVEKRQEKEQEKKQEKKT
ncbi:hypothetical protein NPX13_g8558 [Xylaria arbuscula]|uniref:Uncharacterized protein n=1 Tax=Xylaria arbuscula TaxID=114810 RepID=A0A9W8N8C8_9PEZI|nr:hypothetical protein NPX13_g8558 [Xylaria arbuscula]